MFAKKAVVDIRAWVLTQIRSSANGHCSRHILLRSPTFANLGEKKRWQVGKDSKYDMNGHHNHNSLQGPLETLDQSYVCVCDHVCACDINSRLAAACLLWKTAGIQIVDAWCGLVIVK